MSLGSALHSYTGRYIKYNSPGAEQLVGECSRKIVFVSTEISKWSLVPISDLYRLQEVVLGDHGLLESLCGIL